MGARITLQSVGKGSQQVVQAFTETSTSRPDRCLMFLLFKYHFRCLAFRRNLLTIHFVPIAVYSTGNKISKIVPENWRGLENSLQKLRLGRNAIDKLPADAFAGLAYLDMLDLRENNLKEIDPSVFRDGMAHLVHLYLNGNQLTHVPYAQLSSLKRMKVLDLSYNRISKMLNHQQEPEIRGLQMSLDILRLDFNQIESLMPGDFQHFYKINRTYLDGNPLTMIEVDASYCITIYRRLFKTALVHFRRARSGIRGYASSISAIAI